jgi:hypothetical protein
MFVVRGTEVPFAVRRRVSKARHTVNDRGVSFFQRGFDPPLQTNVRDELARNRDDARLPASGDLFQISFLELLDRGLESLLGTDELFLHAYVEEQQARPQFRRGSIVYKQQLGAIEVDRIVITGPGEFSPARSR